MYTSNINLILDDKCKEPIEIKLLVGELSQVLINIINNAKDILLDRQISYNFV